ncbi:TetR/AcrR family transcriptional regulator [Dactylosporangium sp. CS-047395]|uniref:TetR/AcrR family transcriptional regulator n=1 Tax=Dactylosporangium sp. CS-047395 TaxID=3239936 RepID=UPI003D8ACFD9
METPYANEPVWERPEPQPRAAPVPLNRAKIAAAAVRLADDQGLDGLSVRKLAGALGVGPMRLYDYVANRAEILDLMVDAVYAEIAGADADADADDGADRRATVPSVKQVDAVHGADRRPTVPSVKQVDAVHGETAQVGDGADWRATILAIKHRTRAAALAHEWFADLLGGRPHLGPNALAVGEATAAALSRAPGVRDLDDLQRALGVLNAFMIGALRAEITERRTARTTGTELAAWQSSLGPYLTRMLDTGRYPTVARLVVDGAHLDPDETFARNLATVLQGIT